MPQAITHLSSELLYTALTALFTGLIWVPIIINRLSENGAWSALKNPKPDTRARAEWAYRADHAHRNAIENLAVFAPLAIIVHILGLSTPLTAAAALLFFVNRVAHAVIYIMGIPLARTIAFAIGFFCQMILAWRILM
ncbi:MAPEG family protein [Candidatus Methylospira mobilis]|uniref:MAPEG family protein n=1 Tax=Candidatus Methylospira mobilis TaxID=1808979 RepID=UPI001D175FF7|nr:MAPEG family protein [Candidatus Methylospira mobilis]